MVILAVCLLSVPFRASAISYAKDSLIINNYIDSDIFIEVKCWKEPQVRMGRTWLFDVKMGNLEIAIDIYVTNNILVSKKQIFCLIFRPKRARTKIDGRNPFVSY
jgi:hypothetical protein